VLKFWLQGNFSLWARLFGLKLLQVKKSKYTILESYKSSSNPISIPESCTQFIKTKDIYIRRNCIKMNTLLSTICCVIFFLTTSATLLIVGFSSCAAIAFYSSYLPWDLWLVVAWYSIYRLNSWRFLEDSPPEIVAERF
jgi:hypothetical protein